ncbi:MAG TPA: SRPBCC domain-containing protein [Ohtaekwangia sp.]
MRNVEASIIIHKSPEVVLSAFTDGPHLQNWWMVERSHIDLRKGGLYSLVWQISEKGMGYVSTGIIGEYIPGCQLRVEQLVYFNPKYPILGPMELHVFATPENGSTTLTIIQSGYRSGPDWDWYYNAVKEAWPVVVIRIKEYLEGI